MCGATSRCPALKSGKFTAAVGISANSGHALTTICGQGAMNRPNRQQVDTSRKLSTRFISVIEGLSPRDTSSAASKKRRASSQRHARYAARPSEYRVRSEVCSGVSSPFRPMISNMTWGWLWPSTTRRSISRTSMAPALPRRWPPKSAMATVYLVRSLKPGR